MIVRGWRFSRQRHRPSVTGTENYDDIISKKLLTGGKRKTRNKSPDEEAGRFIVALLRCCIVTALHQAQATRPCSSAQSGIPTG